MIGIVFTLISAILGIAMFGAILLAPGKSEAEATIAGRVAADDGSPAIVSVVKHRAFDGIRIVNTNIDDGSDRSAPAKPPRPSTDQQPRTQVAQIAKPQDTWQMAAQISDARSNGRTLFRQM